MHHKKYICGLRMIFQILLRQNILPRYHKGRIAGLHADMLVVFLKFIKHLSANTVPYQQLSGLILLSGPVKARQNLIVIHEVLAVRPFCNPLPIGILRGQENHPHTDRKYDAAKHNSLAEQLFQAHKHMSSLYQFRQKFA